MESEDSFKEDTSITLVNHLTFLLQLPECAEQTKDKEKVNKLALLKSITMLIINNN